MILQTTVPNQLEILICILKKPLETRSSCVLLNKLLLQKSQVSRRKNSVRAAAPRQEMQECTRNKLSPSKIRSQDLFVIRVVVLNSEDKVKILNTSRKAFCARKEIKV